MVEQLSTANDVIWVDPFGPMNGPIFPKIFAVKAGLKVYNPGLNYLALNALKNLTERRRLLQVSLYLLEKGFDPDIVIIDSPSALPFAIHFRNKGSFILYYQLGESEELSQGKNKVITDTTDLVYAPKRLKDLETDEELFEAMQERVDDMGSRILKAKKKIKREL